MQRTPIVEPCSSGDNLKEVLQTLWGDFKIVTKQFYKNYMVLNSGKYPFMCLGKNTNNETYFFHNMEMKNSLQGENFRNNY